MSSPSSSRPQVQKFLDKLEELQAVFVLGRRFSPFLGEMIHFVQDITVLLEEVNSTIRTRSGHMERATEHLKSVSEATEVATSEILDHSDKVLAALGDIEDELSALEEQFAEAKAADDRLLSLLRDELGEEHEELLEKAERIQDEKQSLRDEWTTQLRDARDALSPIRDRMNQIMMSLQVQDITEQQLSSVNHLIETVRERIDALLEGLGTGQAAEEDVPSGKPSRTATFNMNAEYNRSPERQQMADDLVAEAQSGTAEAPNGTAENGSSTSSNGASSGGPESASQSDIDQMFDQDQGAEEGGNDGSEPASQEEIDELFQ